MSFLFVDRITDLVPNEHIKGIKYVSPHDHYLTKINQDVCFVTSLIGETIGQLAAWNVMQANDFQKRPVAGVVAEVNVHRPAFVGEVLALEAVIDSLDEASVRYHGFARVGTETIFTIQDAIGPLLPMAQFIESSEVRRQFQAIYRPNPQDDSLASLDNLLAFDTTSYRSIPMQFDRILSFTPGIEMKAEMRVSRQALYFYDHFPLNPVLPMTVLLECKMNLAKIFIKQTHGDHAYQVKALRRMKMNEFVRPGDRIISALKVKSQTENEIILNFLSEVAGRRVCVVDVLLSASPTHPYSS